MSWPERPLSVALLFAGLMIFLTFFMVLSIAWVISG